MKINSKAKGNSFELKIAKLLTQKLPLNFIRVPNSGARVGGVNFNKIGANFDAASLNLFVGDVVAVNEADVGLSCKVSIECKSYKTQDNFTALFGASKIYGWMRESEIDAVKTGKVPVLIFKWNNTKTFIASPQLPDTHTQIILKRPEGDIKIGLLDEVLQDIDWWVKPDNPLRTLTHPVTRQTIDTINTGCSQLGIVLQDYDTYFNK